MPSQIYHKLKEKRKIEKRMKATRNPLSRILILCEGIQTEPNYFFSMKEELRLSSVTIKGCGATPRTILDIAKKEYSKYDEIWCVFDRDDFPLQNFNSAIQMSRSNNRIKVAYSNQAFELWYILHFEYLNSGYSRDRFKSKLSKYLSFEYEKNSHIMYNLLKNKQDIAIRNAKTLLASYKNDNPTDNNPSTTVHLLVERLLTLA